MSNLWKRKSLDILMKEGGDEGHALKKTLGPMNLVALGIGAIIGAGLFVRTAAAAADSAGPSVTLAFVVAAVGCAFAGLCYAEFASMIPIAGSAYTYSYATMGELVAWIIGWDLVLEYAHRRRHRRHRVERVPQQAARVPPARTGPVRLVPLAVRVAARRRRHVVAHGIMNIPALVHPRSS